MVIADALTVKQKSPPLKIGHLGTLLAIFLIAIVYLRAQNRPWWCACGEPWPVSLHEKSSHNSQHLFDLWSLTHILHGLLFYGAFKLILPRLSVGWRCVLATAIESAWEMLENSPVIINRYRAATISFGYLGDSIGNSIGDILSCIAGFWLARRIGLLWSVALFLASELFMLVLVRDNLILNTIMLIHPIQAIKQWQGG